MSKHSIIDKVAITVCIYSTAVLVLLAITSFVKSDNLRALIVVVLPLFLLRKTTINKLNAFIHRFLGLNR